MWEHSFYPEVLKDWLKTLLPLSRHTTVIFLPSWELSLVIQPIRNNNSESTSVVWGRYSLERLRANPNRPLSCLPTFGMRAQLGFRKPGKDSIYNGKRTTRIIQIIRFKRPKSQRRTALERKKRFPIDLSDQNFDLSHESLDIWVRMSPGTDRIVERQPCLRVMSQSS